MRSRQSTPAATGNDSPLFTPRSRLAILAAFLFMAVGTLSLMIAGYVVAAFIFYAICAAIICISVGVKLLYFPAEKPEQDEGVSAAQS